MREICVFMTRSFGALLLVCALAQMAWAQDRRDFRWEARMTTCDDGRAGTRTLRFVDGAYQIPTDQFNRRCKLRLVWTLERRALGSFNVAQEAVVRRRGHVVSPQATGGRLDFVGSFRDSNTVYAEIFLNRLPATPIDIGLRVERSNGTVVVSNPPLLRFARGGQTVTSRPEIERVTITNGGSTVTQPGVHLRLETVGAHPTHVMTSENRLFRGARWKTLRAGTGQRQTTSHSLTNRNPGSKTIYVKVRAGNLQSRPARVSFRYVRLADYQTDAAQVLQFSSGQGFQHTATPLNRGATCQLAIGAARRNFPGSGALQFFVGKPGTACRFTLFAGRRLNSDWIITHISPIAKSPMSARVERMPRASDGTMILRIAQGERAPLSGLFVGSGFAGIRVTVRGPAGQDWRDAFRR